MGEKSGPWGSLADGTIWDHQPNGSIARIEFCTGHHKTIYSIKFVGDKDYIAGRRQLYYPDGFDIDGPSEYLVGMNGGYKVFRDLKGDFTAIQWLLFETSLGKVHGPFGHPDEEGCIPFQYRTTDGSIIGFHGRADKHLNAIGVHMKTFPPPSPYDGPAHVEGPWGDPHGGRPWTYNLDVPLTEIVVYFIPSRFVVRLLFKTANDVNGTYFGGDKNCSHMGTPETQIYTIKLSPTVYLTGISGRSKRKQDLPSLSFYTSDGKQHGPFGLDEGELFTFTNEKDDYAITGFHGHSAIHFNTIGVYLKHIRAPSPPPPPPPPQTGWVVTPKPRAPSPAQPTYIFINQWGGPDGKRWKFHPNGALTQIVVCHEEVIVSLRLKSEDGDLSEKLGGNGGTETIIDIKPGVHLEGISGTVGTLNDFTVVTSLTLYTSDGTVHGPFGKTSGSEFCSRFVDGLIAGFHGHASAVLDAIGVYVKPTTTSS